MMESLSHAGTPGNGWRKDMTGAIVYQVEPGSREWHLWAAWLFEHGQQTIAVRAWNLNHRLWVEGPNPHVFGTVDLISAAQARCEHEEAA